MEKRYHQVNMSIMQNPQIPGLFAVTTYGKKALIFSRDIYNF